MKILILGDSFCVTKNDNDHHWVNMLKQHFTIENCASPGIGEYKIFKQYIGQEYDIALVHHTSPYRIHTRYNPLHTGVRRNSDFMLNDVEHHYKNKVRHAEVIYKYISNYVDFDYEKEVWQLYVEKLIALDNSLHFTFFADIPIQLVTNNFNDIFNKHGTPNTHSHLDEKGHDLTYQLVKGLIDKYGK
jgi:hypothetical protein|tara:strand:+ start:1223 stop:1786 length:564 start_codon:yes stop_codon:yes gene_type:complete